MNCKQTSTSALAAAAFFASAVSLQSPRVADAFVVPTAHRQPLSVNTPLTQHRPTVLLPLHMSTETDNENKPTPASTATTTSPTDEERLDQYLTAVDLRSATRTIQSHPHIALPRDRFLSIFQAIEERTSEAEENNLNNRAELDLTQYPPTSPSRNEMTALYQALKQAGRLQLFGAAGPKNDRPLPAMGSKIVTPTLLEQITELSMVSLTPKPTNTLLVAGVALAVAEGFLSLGTGIDLNFLVLSTMFLAFLDKLLVNGAVFETATRTLMPEYRKKILRHEAGHFLCAYLLGCPVEGCVLSAWGALQDPRFGGRATSVSAGTSFFDQDLSEEMNGMRPLSRSSIDRYSVIVMGGIAAEAVNFGRADGGAGDEMALVRFLSSINPRGGGAVSWDAERIKNQARWGAMQAVLLLKEYRASYDALVDALERGGSLGDCIYAIEEAAKKSGEAPLEKPLGYVVERGLYGEWTDVPPSTATNQYATTTPSTSAAPTTSSASSKSSPPVNGLADVINAQKTPSPSTQEKEEDVSASLKELRMAAERKLQEIESKLSEIDNKRS